MDNKIKSMLWESLVIYALLLSLMVFMLVMMTGCNGKDGAQGLRGEPGIPGQIGPAGPVGLDGTQITVVQFCPGTPTYPSSFPEIAFCINSKLYGVYSVPGAFLTYIPPGAYLSVGIGSRCDFTITSGCNVSY